MVEVVVRPKALSLQIRFCHEIDLMPQVHYKAAGPFTGRRAGNGPVVRDGLQSVGDTCFENRYGIQLAPTVIIELTGISKNPGDVRLDNLLIGLIGGIGPPGLNVTSLANDGSFTWRWRALASAGLRSHPRLRNTDRLPT